MKSGVILGVELGVISGVELGVKSGVELGVILGADWGWPVLLVFGSFGAGGGRGCSIAQSAREVWVSDGALIHGAGTPTHTQALNTTEATHGSGASTHLTSGWCWA